MHANAWRLKPSALFLNPCEIRQVTKLILISQSIANQEPAGKMESRVIYWYVDLPLVRLVDQRRRSQRGGLLRQQGSAKVIERNTRLQHALDQQQVLSRRINRRDVEDFPHGHHTGITVAHLRPNKVANHRNLKGAHQVRHENEAVLQNSHHVEGLAGVIPIDLTGQLAHALADRLFVDDSFKTPAGADGANLGRTLLGF